MQSWPSRVLAAIVVGTTLLSAPVVAVAGMIDLQDFAFLDIDDSNYYKNGMDGQFWQGPEIAQIGSSTGNLSPLVLDIGSGPTSAIPFRFQQDGTVVFLDGAGNATGDYIAPLRFSGGYSDAYSNGSFTNGKLDPSYLTATTLPNGAFDPANGLQAFRFQWPQSCPSSNYNGSVCRSDGFVSFQAILIEIDPESFMLQFNYNNLASALNVADTISGAFKLGAITRTYDGPFLTEGPNYCFHNGSLVDCSAVTAAVPEPSTVPLLLAGVTFLGVMTRRRHRSSTRTRSTH